jgi:glycosyltransferase involved in cell wall biosynthesis
MTAQHINLIAWDNGSGLSHDLRLLRETLESLGHKVHVTDTTMLHKPVVGESYDINIMMEHIRPGYFHAAKRNFFIPNPEWYDKEDDQHIGRMEAVLTKTAHAGKLFRSLGVPQRHIGFRSTDCYLPGIPKENTFLHLSGLSRLKGTQRLMEVWARHPEWPMLRVFQAPSKALPNPPWAPNIQYSAVTLPDIRDVRELQNRHRFHVCLSEAEGWGHYYAEAMSCGNIVLTCDAAPMNELVRPDRGLLVKAKGTGTVNSAVLYHFNETALEAAVNQARAMPARQQDAMGRAARLWFDTNEALFPAALQAALA